jgi:hypothetical protein
VSSLHETGELGGRKKGDVARSPPPNDYGFLLIHHPIENAGQIFTEAGVRRFTRHEAPNSYCTAFLYGSEVRHSLRHQVYARRRMLSQADLRYRSVLRLFWTTIGFLGVSVACDLSLRFKLAPAHVPIRSADTPAKLPVHAP